MRKKFLFSLLFCLILALPAHTTTTPAPDPVPGKGKTSSPKGSQELVIVIRTAKDPKVNQIKVGEKGEILIPQSTAIAEAAIAGAAAGGAASPGPSGADAGALKGADAGDDAKSGGDSNKAEDVGGFKGASGISGSGDSKTSGLSSGLMGNDSGFLGGGVPSGLSTNPNTTALIPATTAANPFSTSTTSSTSSTTTPSLPTGELQALLDSSVSDTGVPGAVMAVQTSAGTWIGASGKADLGDATQSRDPQAMTTDTQVRLAGVTRLFTAPLIMKLAEEGKIKLDETVESLLGPVGLPGAVPSSDKITVRLLLNHTSGLHDHETSQEFFADPVLGLIALPTAPWNAFYVLFNLIELYQQTDFIPGAQFQYSSTDYFLLGLLADPTYPENVDTVADMIKTDIFDPLNLSQTTLTRAGSFNQTEPFARNYCWVGYPPFNTTLTDTTDWDLSFDWTNGSGVSTAQDILTFTQALFAGNVVNRQSLAQMITPIAPATTQGFGFEVVDSDQWFGEKMYQSDGETVGAYTRWLYYPDSGRTIFIAFNRGDKRFNTDPPLNPAPDPPQVNASQLADSILSGASAILINANAQ